MDFAVPETLFHPFAQGYLSISPNSRVLFLNAVAGSWLQTLKNTRTDFVQLWKPQAETFEHQGITVTSEITGRDYNLALVLLPKQAEEARYDLARAVKSLKRGGVLVAAAANNAGGGRLEKEFKVLGFSPQSLSKNRARVCWAEVHNLNLSIVDQWIIEGGRQRIDNGLLSQPGLFAWNKIDQGSKILLQHLPALSGRGADFGCGYGYLSCNILQTNSDIAVLYCMDADARAIACCCKNLENLTKEELHFEWVDLSKPVPGLASLDWIVMNPPFHAGKKSDVALGRGFIAAAAAALKPGGILYMVANRQLPYERPLDSCFTLTENIAEQNGFKIFRAVR